MIPPDDAWACASGASGIAWEAVIAARLRLRARAEAARHFMRVFLSFSATRGVAFGKIAKGVLRSRREWRLNPVGQGRGLRRFHDAAGAARELEYPLPLWERVRERHVAGATALKPQTLRRAQRSRACASRRASRD